MKLSKDALRERRQALLCPEGEHAATLADVAYLDKPTGGWIALKYEAGAHELVETFLVRPKLKRLESLSLDHLERLLQAIETTLGLCEIDDLPKALAEMVDKPVQISVKHRPAANGAPAATITAWRARSD